MPRPSAMTLNVRRAALLAALLAPLSCGAGPAEDEASSTALPVHAAATPFPCAATTVVHGSVVIATPQDAVAYRCVSVIDGNLSVLSAPGALYDDIDLSNLEAVRGDVLLAYAPRIDAPSVLRDIRLGKLAAISREAAAGLPEVMLPSAAPVVARKVERPLPPPPPPPPPRGGSLVMSVDFGTAVRGEVAFTLPELSQVDANVAIELKGGGGPVRVSAGLAKLTTVHGDLRLVVSSTSGGHENVSLAPLIGALQTVEGSVTFQPSRENQYGYQLGIKAIGGDLVITPSNSGVGGTWWPSAPFELVASVGGAIRVVNQDLFSRFSATAASLSITDSPLLQYLQGAPTVGGLRIERNPKLTYFDLEGRVTGGGSIVIRDNASLRQCDVDAFLDKQRSLGWTGIATTSGNLGTLIDGRPCPAASLRSDAR